MRVSLKILKSPFFRQSGHKKDAFPGFIACKNGPLEASKKEFFTRIIINLKFHEFKT